MAFQDFERLGENDQRDRSAVPDVLPIRGRVALEERPDLDVLVPLGKATVGQMNMEAKMQEEMKKRAQPITKGLRVWFDQNGQLSYLTDPVVAPSVPGGARWIIRAPSR